MNLFDDLHNAMQPIYEPVVADEPPVFLGHNVDSVLKIDEENRLVEYNGHSFRRQTEVVGVREDGSDAWGFTIHLKENSLYRYNADPQGWWLTAGDTCLSITQKNTRLDVMEIEEDDSITWTRYESEDMDG